MGRKKKVVVEEPTIRRTLELCYVCNKKITGNPISIAKSQKYPDGLFRHHRCEPGGSRWLRSNIGKGSDYRDLYPEDIPEGDDDI